MTCACCHLQEKCQANPLLKKNKVQDFQIATNANKNFFGSKENYGIKINWIVRLLDSSHNTHLF